MPYTLILTLFLTFQVSTTWETGQKKLIKKSPKSLVGMGKSSTFALVKQTRSRSSTE